MNKTNLRVSNKMQWKNIKLIFRRELRDQLRDRRTLFAVAVMPLLLYPLMGVALLQVGQFMRVQPSRVWLINAENLPRQPKLLIEGDWNPDLSVPPSHQLQIFQSSAADEEFQRLIRHYQDLVHTEQGVDLAEQLIRAAMAKYQVNSAVYFAPSDETSLFHSAASSISESQLDSESPPPTESPTESPNAPLQDSFQIFVFVDSSNEKSRNGALQLSKILASWQAANTQVVLQHYDLPANLLDRVDIRQSDVSDKQVAKAKLWSRILPLIIVVWALTGAFYPAIDLCAGEKERGTFETLLSSPAARSEIAIGKLLTVIAFSGSTSLLNLVSMAFTGVFVASKIGVSEGGVGLPLGFPSASSFFWLLVATVPIASLFSAVALAAAAFARSSKEGQYYLIPLMMISMPLMMLPMLPSAELDFGMSLIPVSGLIMLLRALLEGELADVLPYVGPVTIVTLVCCWIAVKWVICQFNSESVLFRPSEQFSVQKWVKSLWCERNEMPSIGSAILCGVVILVCKFFLGFAAFTPENFFDFTIQVFVILLAAVAMPAVLMAMFLSRRPWESLRLRGCSLPMASAAILLAIMINPLVTWVSAAVMTVYPPNDSLLGFQEVVSRIINTAPNWWAILFVFAIMPALFEELAFRGFILSGLESLKKNWQAIVITSLLFGLTHSILQQSIMTFFVGVVLGVIAVQTRSLIPCILFHGVHNSLAITISQLQTDMVQNSFWLGRVLVSQDGSHLQYDLTSGLLMTAIAVALVVWFLKLPRVDLRPGGVQPEASLTSQPSLAQR